MGKEAKVMALASEIAGLEANLHIKREELRALINSNGEVKIVYRAVPRYKKMSRGMRRAWAKKTPEERKAWVDKIVAARRARHEKA
jgi:hypothetical protein